MSYKLNDIKDLNDFNFGNEADALYEYLTSNWDIKAQPKGYTKYLKTYTDYAGMDELDEEALQKSFKGHGDAPKTAFPFVTTVSLPHIAYDDTNQGRNPIRMMISAILSHGMLLGQRMAYLDEYSECSKRMRYAKDAYDKTKSVQDMELFKLYLQEFEKYFLNEHLSIPSEQIHREYEALRSQALQNKLQEEILVYLQEHGSVTLTSQSKGKLLKYWGVLFELYLIYNASELKELLNKQGINIRKPTGKKVVFILSLKKVKGKKS